MNTTIKILLSVLLLGGALASCDDDDKELDPTISADDKVLSYSRDEKGFFLNGEFKVKNHFESDSIIKGYTIFTHNILEYTTEDSVKHTEILGYTLKMEIENFGNIYAYDVKFNKDSTAIQAEGRFTPYSDKSKSYSASITAPLDSIKRPHIPTCTIDNYEGKGMKIQFRQLHTKSKYSEVILPKDDDFTI